MINNFRVRKVLDIEEAIIERPIESYDENLVHIRKATDNPFV